MLRETKVFFTAIMFYTRIPCPKWVTHEAEFLNQSTRYLPLIGWIVGGLSAAIFLLTQYVFPTEISLLLSMVTSILLTGAFHEDGFADVCDGFGGGWTKEKILEIMKDSRVGTYGVVGLLLLLLLKFFTLQKIAAAAPLTVVVLFVTAHALSRLAAVTVIFTTTYSREDASSKVKPVAQQLSAANLTIAFFWVVIPMLYLATINPFFVLTLVPVALITTYLRNYFKRWIGGYTGDCLGATQQVTEVMFYLSVLLVWKLF
ncbi:adenosylcobinamide-GDP ribazoletransferase [Chryseolinea lacunae]|uniref:Adenosylcobinamide-GDP ribazoletransferase n=1 Tax=Chryseolinea lacunae TaxID=2801331 RepID=A0ABS1KNH8_9BACT|nr:adenosylcobinamide-GDP ribazoletransferase [Chryseolinea lacunae]MBL0741014.1 adenosylcobinamide-GDP ribazoletransferase [Chryseolinea lacunae]